MNITQAWLTVCSLFDVAMQFPFADEHTLCSLNNGERPCRVLGFLGRIGAVPLL
jgi:hypothetical protein